MVHAVIYSMYQDYTDPANTSCQCNSGQTKFINQKVRQDYPYRDMGCSCDERNLHFTDSTKESYKCISNITEDISKDKMIPRENKKKIPCRNPSKTLFS